jgi:hypothetical protein
MTMRILIQDCVSDLFLAAGDQWTADDEQALAFESTSAALDECMKRANKSLQIVLKFPKAYLDVALPLKQSKCPPASA